MGRYGGDRLIRSLAIHGPTVGTDPKLYVIRVLAETDKTDKNRYLASNAAFVVNSDEERDNLIKVVKTLSLAVKQTIDLDKENDR